jgi:pimeloyl-ACP methyl ester carboxylesterase
MPTINARGIDLYYETQGQGETLVLLHNGLGCTRNFAQQVDELCKHFTVVAYDRDGYGRSARMVTLAKDWLDTSVDELSCLLDQLGIEKAHLCGVCVGGAIALLFATRSPERVRTIVAAGTCCYGEEGMASKALKLYPPPEELPPDWSRELENCHGRTYWRELYAVFRRAIREENGYPFKGFDLRPILPNVKVPVMIIYGDHDQLFDIEQAVTMHELLERSGLSILPNCGHLPNEEKPEDFNREILGFIRRHRT